MSTSTPWGPSQHSTKHGPGITQYSTAGHGGIKLSEARNARIPNIVKSGTWGAYGLEGWYEEDCDAIIPIVYFPEHFAPETVEKARHWLESKFECFKCSNNYIPKLHTVEKLCSDCQPVYF